MQVNLRELQNIIADIHRSHDGAAWMPAHLNRIFEAAGLPAWDMPTKDATGLADRYDKLLEVIANAHRTHADDLCWMPAEVNRIFDAAGLPPQDLRVGSKLAMLKNCERYVDCLESGGPWRSYAELEAENADLRRQLDRLNAALAAQPLTVQDDVIDVLSGDQE